MVSYIPDWTDHQWRVTESHTTDDSIKEGNILRFAGLGFLHDPANQLFNETTKPQEPWASMFSYDEAKNKVVDLLRSNMRLVITYSAANNTRPAKLTCTLADPTQGGPVTGPTGGTCWIAESGG